MSHDSPEWLRRSAGLAVLIVVSLALAVSAPSFAQGTGGIPAVWYIGIMPSLAPGDSLQFRMALAYGIDRVAVARAAASLAPLRNIQPAWGIQHPSLPGCTPSVRGPTYDPARAKELFSRSGWTSAISILTVSSTSDFLVAEEDAIVQSLRASTGATVSLARVANFGVLTSSTRSGNVPMWLYGWRADRGDFGYPSMPLGLAHEYFTFDPEVRALVERGAGQEVEEMLLNKALVIPIDFYLSL